MFDLMPFGDKERGVFAPFGPFADDFFKGFEGPMSRCRTDIIDKGDCYLVQAELPGFKKEDLHVDIEGDYMTVRAERSEETGEEKETYVRRERRVGQFSRSFDVSGIRTEDIKAAYENGVLTLTLPKMGEEKPTTKKIEIH